MLANLNDFNEKNKEDRDVAGMDFDSKRKNLTIESSSSSSNSKKEEGKL